MFQRAGDHPPQGGGFGGGKRAVGLHPLHGETYLLLVVGVFEGLVHQDAEIAGREFHLFLLLEITLRGEPQAQVGARRGVVFQHDVLGAGRFAAVGDRAAELAEFEPLARLGDGVTPFGAAREGFVAVGEDALEEQSADGFAALLRDEDMQRFGGARQRHVQQIDVVDVRVDQFPVVLRRESRFGHRLLVFHRKASHGFGVAVRLGPDDVGHVAARLGVQLPRAVGDQHHALF